MTQLFELQTLVKISGYTEKNLFYVTLVLCKINPQTLSRPAEKRQIKKLPETWKRL